MIRVSSTVSAWFASLKPGVIAGTSHGAATKTIAPSTTSPMSIRLMTVETTFQARSFAPLARSPDTIGISADDSAPAATSWKIRSGMRNAAKKASRSDAFADLVDDDDRADPAEHPRREERGGHDQARAGQGAARRHGRGSRRARGCASR